MRGHEPLLAMRRNGKRPAHVTLHSHAGRAHAWWAYPEGLPFPEVHVEPADTPELLDLRFLVGLPVIVDAGADVARMRRLVLAAESAGAERVYGFAAEPLGHGRFRSLAAVCTAGEDQQWRN